MLLFVVTGIFTYLQIPKRDIPEIKQNIASISTVYPGANAEIVEADITNPIEDLLIDLDGVENVTSASATSFSTITVSVENSDNPSAIYSSIQQAVTEAAKSFPDQAQAPDVETDIVTSSVATYHLLSEDQESLYDLRDELDEWEESLTELSGVESLQIKGMPDEVAMISLDQDALEEEQIQPNQVITAIQNEISPTAIGTEKNEDTIYQLKLDSISDFNALSELYIAQNPAGEAISLGDIASLSMEKESPEDLITYEGKAALSITVFAQEGINITSLQEQINEKVDKLSGNLPDGIEADLFYTQSEVIDEVYSSLLTSFAISLFSVVIIMVLGLPISSAILVALAIPLSIIIGLIPLPYSGVDLNQISIIGIIVAIGILVDDAIVVNDNIMRRFQLGDNPLDGTIRGVKEVGVSIVTSTLLIVFSFFPLTFLSGSNGDFIRALPLALIFTIIASTTIALTVIPSVQYARQLKIYKTKKRKIGLLTNFFRKLETVYAEKILPRTIKKPWITVVSGIVLCVLLLLLAIKVPFEFFPAADREEVTVSVKLKDGTPIDETDQLLEEMETYILEENEHVTETVRYTGSGLPNIFNSGLNRSGENTGQLAVRIDRDTTSATEFIENNQQNLRETFPDGEIFLETIVSGPPPSAALEVKLQGPDLDMLTENALAIQEDLTALDSVEIATTNAGSTQPVRTYEIDRDFLAEEGVALDQVRGTLQLANTAIPLGELDENEQIIPLQLILDEGEDNGIDLSALTLFAGMGEDGAPQIYSFDEFIDSTTDQQIGAIPHDNGKRTITISAYENEDVGTFSSDTADILDSYRNDLDSDYQLIEDGEASAETEFFVEVAKLFVVVLFLIYVTLAIQFNSLLTPVLITSTVFLAITGAIVGLFVSGQPLSFLAVLGIVSLSGVVVRNSILIIEFIEQNKERDKSINEAIIAAGRARFRPILLTTLTSIAALSPIIFTGDVLFRPLAVSIVAGIIFSTTLTLLLLPAFYLTMEGMRSKKQMKKSTS